MAAVSKAFYDTPDRKGLVIGVLPGDESAEESKYRYPRQKDEYPNQWVEIPVQTHLFLSGEHGTESLSRNHINVLTSDVVVVLPGGPGTLSEVELAVRYERPVIAFVESDDEICGLPNSVATSASLEGEQKFVEAQLGLAEDV